MKNRKKRLNSINLLSIVALNLFAFSAYSQSSVSGYVFDDVNANNKRDKKEIGISNVAVSNGRDVVLTDSKGLYTLSAGNDDIIFVIKPSDYQVRINDNKLPEYYYIHKPLGSPDSKYKGVSPTGKLPESVDFALTRRPENDKFSILVFGDPQASSLEEVDFFERGIINEIIGEKKAVFGLSLGDLAFNKLEVFDPYIKAVSKVGVPWHNVIGNHDLNFDVSEDSLSDETFEAHFGPSTYSFNYGNVHFIVLDNILYPNPKTGKGYRDGLRKDQLSFIENDLKVVSKDKLIVLAMHIPLNPEQGGANMGYTRHLFNLLADFPYTLSLSAHTHRQYQNFFTESDGWHQKEPHHHYNVGTTSGNWYSGEHDKNGIPISKMADGTPKGYAYINFENNKYTIDYKVAGKSQDYQMGIWMPKVLEQNVKAAGGMYVNFFMGHKNSQVEFRIDGGKWKKMERIDDYDPSYLHSLLKWDTTDTLLSGTRRPGLPKKSPHLWWVRLDNSLPIGEHVVEIKATDLFGRDYIQERTYRIAGRKATVQTNKLSYKEIALDESLIPIHPGVPGKVPFWNGHAERFIYAPAFNFKKIPTADKYRFKVTSFKNNEKYSFESDVPYAPLSPIWGKVPVGHFGIEVIGVSAQGDSIGLAGKGKYYRAAPFNGIYHTPILPYDKSAQVALDRLLKKDYVNYWLTYKIPDPDYINYRYPAKIMSALIVGAVTHARLKQGTEDAKRSTKLAGIIADYLISISYPKSSIWPDFPPTYHGPRIGENPKSHMQLVNNLTIIGADAGNAYLDLYDLNGEKKYLDAAKRIAETYKKTQMENGTWYLYVNHETGKPLDKNLAIPTAVVNYFERLQKDYNVKGLEQSTNNALKWLMNNPVKTFDWQAQFEDVKTYPPYERLSREQSCDLAIYLFKKGENIPLAEELVRFSEDQFVIWEQADKDYVVKSNNVNPGWYAKNWITPSVQEQYGFWMPVNRSAGIMIQTYWEAYEATKKEIYLAKAKSIANAITVVQQANDGDYPTMFISTPWRLWLNSTVYPAKVLMTLEKDLERVNK